MGVWGEVYVSGTRLPRLIESDHVTGPDRSSRSTSANIAARARSSELRRSR